MHLFWDMFGKAQRKLEKKDMTTVEMTTENAKKFKFPTAYTILVITIVLSIGAIVGA